MIQSREVNRTATFVFYIGEHFFGTLTAFVHGPAAANYRFTSGLQVQVLKALAPVLIHRQEAAHKEIDTPVEEHNSTPAESAHGEPPTEDVPEDVITPTPDDEPVSESPAETSEPAEIAVSGARVRS